ncbi:MAG TPA: hypothetical protein VGD10_12200 [Allosphingosinicella sp.]|uniref:hypothetical protein n=1 Tax=Allosphingosinicella sp. TaxID=2823234 RepID=UPI002ED9688E
MNKLTKTFLGAGTAALMTVTAAAPANAQIYRNRDRGGIDVGDIVTGVVIAGAAAAAIGALSRAANGGRYGGVYEGGYGYPQGSYGYPQGSYGAYGSGYGYGPQAAVNVCGAEAQRYGQGGRVTVTDVDRKGSRSYRVKGVIDAGYNNGGYYNRGYGYNQRAEFKCTAREDGRITDFDLNR